MAKATRYIAYYNKPFNEELFLAPEPITSRILPMKPKGAIWASRADDEGYTWRKWCEDEDFGKPFILRDYVIFHIKRGSRVLKLHTKEDFNQFIAKYGYKLPNPYEESTVDWAVVARDYDVVDYKVRNLYYEMYGWDCDTLCVLNKEKVVVDEVFKHDH